MLKWVLSCPGWKLTNVKWKLIIWLKRVVVVPWKGNKVEIRQKYSSHQCSRRQSTTESWDLLILRNLSSWIIFLILSRKHITSVTLQWSLVPTVPSNTLVRDHYEPLIEWRVKKAKRAEGEKSRLAPWQHMLRLRCIIVGRASGKGSVSKDERTHHEQYTFDRFYFRVFVFF